MDHTTQLPNSDLTSEVEVRTTTPTAKPQVEDYLDARAFLNDYFTWRKQTESGFSYASWSAELKFSGRSFLRLMMIGERNFTEASIHRIGAGMKLKPREQEHFFNIVKMQQATSSAERTFYAEKIRQRSKGRHREVTDHLVFLSNRQLPRLQTLLSIPNLKRTSSELSRVLGISESAVMSLLKQLEELGLAESSVENREQVWSATSRDFKIEDKLGDVALQNFHRKSLEEALKAIDLPSNERDFRSAFITVDENSYQQLTEELNSFLTRLVEKYQVNERESRNILYQINLNAIPMGKPFTLVARLGLPQEITEE